MTTIFCSNESCEAEAVAYLVTDHGTRCPVCETCRAAFEWGQESPEAEIEDIDQGDDDDGEEGVEIDMVGAELRKEEDD
jgi:hypothetical protein